MKTAIIILLLFLCLILLVHILNTRKQLKEILWVLKSVKKGDNCKAFTKGKGMPSQICFEINDILFYYQKQISRLKDMEQSNKELLTSLSHDVRTPLTSLMGYLDALEKGIVFDDEKEKYISIARKKAYDLKSFVEALFEWFKIDSNELHLNLEAIDINELTREILIDFLPSLEQRKIRLEGKLSDEEFIVKLDKGAYGRILSNLIENALLYGGDCLEISIERQDTFAKIIVRDNGSGIAQDKLPYVFDRLYKGDSARSSGGSGLGLSIVKGLVEAHKGKVFAESSLNEYTSFIILLPV